MSTSFYEITETTQINKLTQLYNNIINFILSEKVLLATIFLIILKQTKKYSKLSFKKTVTIVSSNGFSICNVSRHFRFLH